MGERSRGEVGSTKTGEFFASAKDRGTTGKTGVFLSSLDVNAIALRRRIISIRENDSARSPDGVYQKAIRSVTEP